MSCYLGMIFDEKLNSQEHLKKKDKKCMNEVYGLYGTGLLSESMNLETKLYIYNT